MRSLIPVEISDFGSLAIFAEYQESQDVALHAIALSFLIRSLIPDRISDFGLLAVSEEHMTTQALALPGEIADFT